MHLHILQLYQVPSLDMQFSVHTRRATLRNDSTVKSEEEGILIN